jgi:hypothetical protein
LPKDNPAFVEGGRDIDEALVGRAAEKQVGVFKM